VTAANVKEGIAAAKAEKPFAVAACWQWMARR